MQQPRADGRGGEAAHTERQAEHDRNPLQRYEAQHAMDSGEHREPERARVRLHPLTCVEYGAVAGQKLVDHAEVDESVVSRPPMSPAKHGKQGAREEQQRPSLSATGRSKALPRRQQGQSEQANAKHDRRLAAEQNVAVSGRI